MPIQGLHQVISLGAILSLLLAYCSLIFLLKFPLSTNHHRWDRYGDLFITWKQMTGGAYH